MSLMTYHPVVSPGFCLCYLNSAYDGMYQYISETCMRPRNFIATSQQHETNVASSTLMVEVPNLVLEANNLCAESKTSHGIFPSHESFNFQKCSLYSDTFTKQSSSLLESCKSLECPKRLGIWRPFTPSPVKDSNVQNDISEEYRSLSPIIPSRMKIEHSKTSLFKPVKKREFRCNHCPSNYTSSAQLISHLRVHTGAKPFSCDHPDCPKTFARNEELTRHRRIHSGDKPHLCAACGKSFGRKDHLSKHAKTHLHASEKRAYVCGVPGCGHRYTRSDALTRHRTSAHNPTRRKDH